VVLAGCRTAPTAPAVSGTDLETTRLRLVQTPSMCQAAQYVAEDLLRTAGFTDVAYVKKPNPTAIGSALASGEADINLHVAGPLLTQIDAGDAIVVLAGAHIGCFELFGTDRVQAIHAYGWRDDDAQDSLRFYGLRLYEAGMVKQDPNQLIARGTNWQPLADVKRDLAASPTLAYCPLPSPLAAALPSRG
jgi:hypothetical protein